MTELRTTRRRRTLTGTAAGVATAMALLAPVAAGAQTADPEVSCIPDTIAVGATTTCVIAGVAPSRPVELELRSGTTVVATADGVAATDGTASITLEVPTSAPTGSLRVALVGTSVAAVVEVTPARPSGVSAGLGPSTRDVDRALPTAMLIAGPLVLLGTAVASLRRRRGGAPAGIA